MSATVKKPSNKPYWAKLQDPRWKEKRKQIVERDKYICQCCGKRGEPLDVHHRYYRPNREPWQYPDWSLETLCRQCHGEFGHDRDLFEKIMELFDGSGDVLLAILAWQISKIHPDYRYKAMMDLSGYVEKKYNSGGKNAH